MKVLSSIIITLLPIILLLFNYSYIGEKSASVSIIYGATTIFSLLLFLGFHFLVRKKDKWFYLLFSSVLVVNAGYYLLSISANIESALMYNRISYFGSVFLPLSMLFVIMNVSNITYKKALSYILFSIAFIIFFITATPGFSDIYYKDVSIETVNGVTILNKVYGKWHCVYLYYLLTYFTSMISVIVYSSLKRKVASNMHAIVLAFAVLINIGVWLIEQLVEINFEFLSVSYIISEIFLLGIYILLQEKDGITFGATKLLPMPKIPDYSLYVNDSYAINFSHETSGLKERHSLHSEEMLNFFKTGISELTPTETKIYKHYISGKSIKEVMNILDIKENTIKFHNKNIYKKLGVSSRKQMIEIGKKLNL